jgi:hypothetical protein
MVNNLLKKFYRKVVPFTVRGKIGRYRCRNTINVSKARFEQQETYFKTHIDEFMFDDTRKTDILRIFAFLRKNGHITFPEMDASIHKKYFTRKLKIEKDLDTELFYVSVDNNSKKLFYKNGMDKNAVYNAFNYVSIEQDYASPHRYLTNDQQFVGVMDTGIKHVYGEHDSFGVVDGAIVVDAGAAEGNFALSIIEKASKVYIIEGDEVWCETLKRTFLPYKEKVVIIQKYLSDISDDNNITLVDLIKTYNIDKIDFLKMDIEGYEKQALHGGTVGANFVNIDKMAICVYHNPEDEKEISNYVTHHGYKFYLTDGYMVLSDSKEPPIRKAVLRAHK